MLKYNSEQSASHLFEMWKSLALFGQTSFQWWGVRVSKYAKIPGFSCALFILLCLCCGILNNHLLEKYYLWIVKKLIVFDSNDSFLTFAVRLMISFQDLSTCKNILDSSGSWRWMSGAEKIDSKYSQLVWHSIHAS